MESTHFVSVRDNKEDGLIHSNLLNQALHKPESSFNEIKVKQIRVDWLIGGGGYHQIDSRQSRYTTFYFQNSSLGIAKPREYNQ